MTAIKNAVLGILAFCAVFAVLKFILIPSTGNVVPVFESGKMVGFSYRVDSWWGLAHHDYQAAIKNGQMVYFKDDSQKALAVPERAYENR